MPEIYTKDQIDQIGIKIGESLDLNNTRIKSEVQSLIDGLEPLKGDTGAEGTNGKSAYQIALDNGYIGTEVEWLESLKGAASTGGSGGSFLDDGREIKTKLVETTINFASWGGYLYQHNMVATDIISVDCMIDVSGNGSYEFPSIKSLDDRGYSFSVDNYFFYIKVDQNATAKTFLQGKKARIMVTYLA